ncbi:MAG: GIY-YIG nuclease family protein [Acidobacteria bacterium]|nr:GIY-YIG nuclease family protein [Acidobacteriota bacterium]
MNKKDLIREYKETRRPMGVFQIRNLTNDRLFIGSSTNLEGIFNRHRFQLVANGHPNKALQADWNALGAESFAFEVLEELDHREGLDDRKELEFLEDLWLEKAAPYGERGYNEPKKSREERLRMIADKNRKV